MDDQEIAVRVPAADETNVNVCRVKYEVARLSVAPCNVGAIAVLCGSSAAVPRIVAAVCCVVERPIDEPTTIQSKRSHRAGGAAACGGDFGRPSRGSEIFHPKNMTRTRRAAPPFLQRPFAPGQDHQGDFQEARSRPPVKWSANP